MTPAIHTIPVPKGWSAEQAWEAISRGDDLEGRAATWANVHVEDGRMLGLVKGGTDGASGAA